MAVVAVDFKARGKSRAKRFEAWSDEECGSAIFSDVTDDPTLYGVEDVGESHGLAHLQLLSASFEARDDDGHMFWTDSALLAEPLIAPDDRRIERLAVRLRAFGIGMKNARRGFISSRHTALIYFVRSNKRAWFIAPALFGGLNAYDYARCLAFPPFECSPLIRGVSMLFRDDDFELAHERMLSLFSLT